MLCVCALLGHWTATNNVYNTTNFLFMLVTVIVYGSTAYIPAIILERPLYIRQGTRLKMHDPVCTCVLLVREGSTRRRRTALCAATHCRAGPYAPSQHAERPS